MLSPVQNVRPSFPHFYTSSSAFPLAKEGLADLDDIFSVRVKDPEIFHSNAGELCYSFLQSKGESPQRKWLAVFVYEKGYAIHDGKMWTYAIFA